MVSIILPTYNGRERIGSAIRSVLNQSYDNFELLIIDDGSPDSIDKIIGSFNDHRVKYFKNEKNLGIQKTLNRGLKNSTGDYIARIDDDDEWIDKDKLQKQVRFLEQNKDHVLVGTSANIIDGSGVKIAEYDLPTTDAKIRERMLLRNCFLHSTILVRRSVLGEVGGYSENENIRHVEDYELWLRVGVKGKIANIPDVTTNLMVHSSSITAQNRVTQSKKIMYLIKQNKTKYPNYLFGYMLLTLRIFFFKLIYIIPFPKTLLYRIQRLYKSF